MSTKIYNAYRAKKDELPKIIRTIQSMKTDFRKKYFNEVWYNLKLIFEEHARKNKELNFEIYKQTIHERDKMSRLYDLNPEFGVSLFLDKNYVYLRFYGDDKVRNEFLPIFEKKTKVQEYEYWNSTEGPSNLTKAQWSQRRRDWEKLLKKGTGYSLTHFLHIEIVPDFISIEEVPYFIRFADTTAENFLTRFNELYKEYQKERITAK